MLNADHIREYRDAYSIDGNLAALRYSSRKATDGNSLRPDIRIVTYNEVDSTNMRVKEDRADCDYCVHTALIQTQGYGRQGRSWTSPLGGLYASLGINLASYIPVPLRDDISTLSLVVGLSVKAALERVSNLASQAIQIKWPNDVLVHDAKICGISLELFNTTFLCIGVGINVIRDEVGGYDGKYRYAYACEGIHRAGTELSAHHALFMEKLLGCFLAEFERRFVVWLEKGFTPFVEPFNASLAWKERLVAIERIDGVRLDSGIIVRVTERGTLLLANPDNPYQNPQEVASGEVHFLPLEQNSGLLV